ncbi:hypothetical protein D9M68_929380 [compost metagenome]
MFQHAQGVDAGIDFRMMGFGLGHAKQRIDLGHQDLEGRAVAQDLDKYLWLFLHESARNFLPTALGRQCFQLAGVAELAHQFEGFVRHLETQWSITRGKAGNPQDSERIFGESGGNVT